MESRNKLTMCRLCLTENECFINIFEMNDWQGYVAADAISDLLQFQVSETDGYPHVVCLTCLTKLTDFRQFKECCQKSKVTYYDMFVSRGCLEEHKPEMVEFVAVKAEPIYHSDNEDNASKVSNDLDGTAGDEFKEEPMEDIVDGVHCSEFCEEDPLRQSSSDMQLKHGYTVTHPQYIGHMEHKRPHCASDDADSFNWNLNTNEESTFGKSEHVPLSVGVEASSSETMERLERQCISPGEKIYMAPLFQEDVGIWKEGVKDRGREKGKRGGKGNGRRGTGSEKRMREGKKGLICSHCGKVLMSKHGLVGHLKLHGYGHTYNCDVCKKAFQSKTILMNHIRSHTGAKPYKCAECSKTFSENGNLKIHMRSHTGSKPYKCEECSKSFSQSGSLKRHVRIHTGSKPYKCKECSKSFSQNGVLQTHMRLHTGDKPYTCTECSKSFRQNGNLKKHMRTHTGS